MDSFLVRIHSQLQNLKINSFIHISLLAGSLSITLSLNEVKCKDHYYRDLTSSDHLGYPVFGSTGALSQYGGYSGGHLGGHTNLGYSSDTISMYGSKPAINSAIYMTPHMEEDRFIMIN